MNWVVRIVAIPPHITLCTRKQTEYQNEELWFYRRGHILQRTFRFNESNALRRLVETRVSWPQVALHCVADSMDLRTLELQIQVLPGLAFESSPATLLDGVQSLLGGKVLGSSRCTSQIALRHLQDWSHEVCPAVQVQSFSGTSGSLSSPRLSLSSRSYSWATLSSRRRRTSSQTCLDSAILRDLSCIFTVATESL